MSRLGMLSTLAALLVAAACGTVPAVSVDHSGDAGVPAPRTDASSAYDAANATIVMFGGVDRSGNLAETWTWDGDTWRRRHPAHTPPARELAVMAFDPATNRVILFGGLSCSAPAPNDTIGCDYVQNATKLSDTWSWDGRDWSQVKTAHSPDVSYFHDLMVAAAGDPATDQVILANFVKLTGAVVSQTVATWTLHGGDWLQLHPRHAPSDEEFGGPAFDAASGRLLLQENGAPDYDCSTSSCFQPSMESSTWAWDGSDWKDLGRNINSPHAYGTLVGAGRSGLMLIGLSGILMWNGSRWESAAPLPWADGFRSGWTGSFDGHTGQVVLYGGRSWETNHLYGDTVGWNGKRWSTLVEAPPSPSVALGPCDPNEAVAGYGGYGGGPSISPTSTAIGIAFFEPRAGPCHFDTVVTFRLTGPDGKLLPITGNPSHIEIVADLTYDWGFQYATFTVTNYCELPEGTMATFGGADIKAGTPFSGQGCPGVNGPVTITPGTLHRPDEK